MNATNLIEIGRALAAVPAMEQALTKALNYIHALGRDDSAEVETAITEAMHDLHAGWTEGVQ